MTDIGRATERRWDVAGLARIGEIMTGDEAQPVVYAVQLRENPVTRAALEALRDLIAAALDESAAGRIVVPPRGLAVPR